MSRTLLIPLLVLALLIGACGSSTTESTLTSLVEEATGVDVSDTVEEVEEQVESVAADVAESPAAAELSAAWEALKSEISSATATLQAEGAVDSAAIEQAMDSFESTLDNVQAEAGTDLEESWSELRSLLEDLVS